MVTSISLCEAILEREAQETRESTDIYREIIRGLDVEHNQREREVTALRAQVDTWDPKVRQQRMGNEGGNGIPATPGQPTLHISLLKQPMQLVKNQAQAADLGIEIHPVSEKAATDIAETMQDHYRAIG